MRAVIQSHSNCILHLFCCAYFPSLKKFACYGCVCVHYNRGSETPSNKFSSDHREQL